MYNVKIKGELCIGCRFCAVTCPNKVLDLRSEVLAFVAAPEKCDGCKLCEQCPEDAITVEKK